MTENILIVLVGPPGSGKTTWARQNGRGAVHVSQDDLIDAITPDGFDHIYRPVYRAAEDAVAREALRAGHTVIVDRTNRTRGHRMRWLEIARETDTAAVAVVMTTPESICRQRNAERTDARRLSEERMDRMFAAIEPVTPDEGFQNIYDGDWIRCGADTHVCRVPTHRDASVACALQLMDERRGGAGGLRLDSVPAHTPKSIETSLDAADKSVCAT